MRRFVSAINFDGRGLESRALRARAPNVIGLTEADYRRQKTDLPNVAITLRRDEQRTAIAQASSHTARTIHLLCNVTQVELTGQNAEQEPRHGESGAAATGFK